MSTAHKTLEVVSAYVAPKPASNLMSYELSTDPSRIQLDVVHQMLANSYWTPNVKRDIVEKALANSIVIGAYDKETGKQVGYARVVTDCTTFAWLCDVIVADEHRGKGLGKQMVGELIKDERLKTLRRWVLATADAHSLYEKFGFTTVQADRWMEMRLPASNWQDA